MVSYQQNVARAIGKNLNREGDWHPVAKLSDIPSADSAACCSPNDSVARTEAVFDRTPSSQDGSSAASRIHLTAESSTLAV